MCAFLNSEEYTPCENVAFKIIETTFLHNLLKCGDQIFNILGFPPLSLLNSNVDQFQSLCFVRKNLTLFLNSYVNSCSQGPVFKGYFLGQPISCTSLKVTNPVIFLKNDSDSFKAFCKYVHVETFCFKSTAVTIPPNLLNIPPTSFQNNGGMHRGRLDGCYHHGGGCWLHPASIFLTMSMRVYNRISSPHSTLISLLRQAGLPKHCRRRLLHSVGLCKSSYSYLPYFYILILLAGDIQPNPGPLFPAHRRYSNAKSIIAGAWNVRTLLEKKRSHMRPTAIVARLLREYRIDICALSETRVHGEHKIQEVEAGYTFFLNGRPADKPPQIHGVGFAIRTDLVAQLNGKLPVGINERLMTLCLPVQGCNLHIISAYAPTMTQSHDVIEQFYHKLRQILDKIPPSDKILLLGDFNARVGTDHEGWDGVLGKHGVGNENSNGTALLSLCSQKELIITNTLFRQDDVS